MDVIHGLYIKKHKKLYIDTVLIYAIGDKMPISFDKNRPLTARQNEIAEGIKEGLNQGKTSLEIGQALNLSEAYINEIKMRAGMTKQGSEILDWIEKHEEVGDWLREIKGGEAHESTKKLFTGSLKKYCEFRGLTPGELLTEGEEDLKLPREQKQVKRHLLDFRDYLKEGGRGKRTVAHYLSVITSFFTSHDVLLPKLSNGSIEVEWEKKEFDRARVKELVNVCSPRERAMFMTMFQSGLAANEVSSLRIKDLAEVKDGLTILRLKREKNGYRFVTFLGSDAREAIDHYLKIRNEGNLLPSRPKLSAECKVKSENDYLFVTWDARLRAWNKINSSHVSKYMMQACRRLGWFHGEKRNPYRPHALRASFATVLLNNGVPKNAIDFMLGHKQNGTDEAYFKTHIETLIKQYKASEHLLSISEIDKIPDSKYEELMIELHARNGKISELEEKMTLMDAREKERAASDNKLNRIFEGINADPEDLKLMMELLKRMKDKGVV
jgi:integrase